MIDARLPARFDGTEVIPESNASPEVQIVATFSPYPSSWIKRAAIHPPGDILS
jgi:hypothetical protein